jgi:hypothetical protein
MLGPPFKIGGEDGRTVQTGSVVEAALDRLGLSGPRQPAYPGQSAIIEFSRVPFASCQRRIARRPAGVPFVRLTETDDTNRNMSHLPPLRVTGDERMPIILDAPWLSHPEAPKEALAELGARL